MTAPPGAARDESGPRVGWLQRASPIPTLAWMLAGVATAAVTFHPVVLAAISLAVLVLAVSSGVLRPRLRAMLAFAPLAASILLVQVLAPAFCRPSCTVAATVGPFTLHAEGVAHGLVFVARLLTIELVAFLVILTTRAPDVLAALTRLRVPPSVGFAAAMTLQLVPVLRREVRIVLDAQRARGLRAAGPTALVRALVPVMVASVERAQQLAISIEARGFGSSRRRTSYHDVVFGRADAAWAVAGLVAAVAGVVAGLTSWGPDRVVWPALPAWAAIAVLVVAALAFGWAIARGIAFALRA
jgi:energy-coupling factor transport system permease protein